MEKISTFLSEPINVYSDVTYGALIIGCLFIAGIFFGCYKFIKAK